MQYRDPLSRVPGEAGALPRLLCPPNCVLSRLRSSIYRTPGIQADYDNAKTWTVREAREKIAVAQSAFQNWGKVRADPAANEYLLSLLIGKKRE